MNTKLLKTITTIFDKGIDVLAFVCGAVLVLIWVIVCNEVILRFIVNYSIPWAVEVNEFSLMLVTFLGAAWLLKGERHIKIDIVYARLNPRAQALLNIINSFIGVVICLFFVIYGLIVSVDHLQRGVVSFTVMRFPTWPRYAVITLGSLLLLIQFLRRAYSNLMLWRVPKGKECLPGEETTKPLGEA